MEKYGFVYIWFDKKRKMYYIGSHWGNIDDGYICSSNRMRDTRRNRPQDFKRRIIKKHLTKEEMINLETKFLSLIKKEELGKKYYNLQNNAIGFGNISKRFSLEHREKMSKALKGKWSWAKGQTFSEEHRRKISESNKGKKFSEKHRTNLAKSLTGRTFIHTEETKKKIE